MLNKNTYQKTIFGNQTRKLKKVQKKYFPLKIRNNLIKIANFKIEKMSRSGGDIINKVSRSVTML